MKRLMKWGFGIALAVLWIVVAGLCLEVWARWQYRVIERAGALRPVQQNWNPPPGAVETSSEANTGAIAAGVDVPAAPDHLGTRFAAMSEDDRVLYAELRDESIAIYGRDGRVRSTYGREDTKPAFGFDLNDVRNKRIDELLVQANTPVLETLDSVIEHAKPAVIDATIPLSGTSPRVVETSLFPMGDQAVCAFRDISFMSLTDRMARMKQPDDPLWVAPWVEYRKNLVGNGMRFTNNVGFHDDDVILPKPADVIRIVCIGGSTTLEGNSIASTYPNLLERALRERFQGKTIDVINCGVGGIGSLGECRRTLDYIRLQPDLAIHYNYVNDLCHTLFPLWDDQAPRWQRWIRRSMFVNLHVNDLLLPPRRQIEEQMEFLTFRNMRRMRDAFTRRGIEIMFCSFAAPDYSRLSAEERRFFESNLRTQWQGRFVSLRNYCRLIELYNERLRAFCAETGVRYIPVSENLKGGANYFIDICHMTTEGIYRKADVIADQLADWVGKRAEGVLR